MPQAFRVVAVLVAFEACAFSDVFSFGVGAGRLLAASFSLVGRVVVLTRTFTVAGRAFVVAVRRIAPRSRRAAPSAVIIFLVNAHKAAAAGHHGPSTLPLVVVMAIFFGGGGGALAVWSGRSTLRTARDALAQRIGGI